MVGARDTHAYKGNTTHKRYEASTSLVHFESWQAFRWRGGNMEESYSFWRFADTFWQTCRCRGGSMEESGENLENSRAASKSAAAGARKVNAIRSSHQLSLSTLSSSPSSSSLCGRWKPSRPGLLTSWRRTLASWRAQRQVGYSPTVCRNQLIIYGLEIFPVRSVCVRGIRDMNSDGFWKPVDDIFQILFRK